MDLSLENLDDIYHSLIVFEKNGEKFFKDFEYIKGIGISSEQRKLIDTLVNGISAYILEVSYIKSFLQSCDYLPKEVIITDPQKETLKICYQLCEKLELNTRTMLGWTIELKLQINQASCPIPDELGNINLNKKPNCQNISATIFEAYQQTRAILKEIYTDLMSVDASSSNNIFTAAGKNLDLMEGRTLFIETEHEMNMLIDYGLFQCFKNGKNVVEQYFDAHYTLYGPKKLTILRGLKNAKFSFLETIRPIDKYGVMMHDHLTDQLVLIIDKGLYQAVQLGHKYAVLTHYLETPQFALTTGAATPVLLYTSVGQKMWNIFEKIIKYNNDQLSLFKNSDRQRQCITDLYKIVIHEDVAKTVISNSLPIDHHKLNQIMRRE